MYTNIELQIIDIVSVHGNSASKQIFDLLNGLVSYSTVKRILNKLGDKNLLIKIDKGKATKYALSPIFALLKEVDLEEYFTKEIDERSINENFNLEILSKILSKHKAITPNELTQLQALQALYKSNIDQLSQKEYIKELERLAIDLSWKSSQIEGNTYSLLETERLLIDKQTAAGKTKEEAIMLLNHKEAIDFIIQHPDYLSPLSVAKIEDIHSILIKDLAVERNLRKGRVGISGTNYKPLDNTYQIKDALENMCKVINEKDEVFEKALLALVLLSYIQPFVDGNKRTARIVSNAILINNQHCPISFRTVDSIVYKKAMLVFYEQNNISAIKNIFIGQFEFAVKTYF